MFAIVVTLFNSFVRLLGYLGVVFNWLAYWFMQLWGAFVAVIQLVINVIATGGAFVLTVITDVVLLLLTLAVSLLPGMPDATIEAGGVDLVFLNRYFPMGEVFSFGVVWAVVFGGIGAYKLAKFIRGAG